MGGENITFFYRNRKIIFISTLVFIITAIIICIFIFNKKPTTKNKPSTSPIIKKKIENKETTVKEELFKIDIKGEINNPGIYEMPKNSRIIDVINKAGGLTENANTSVINLSKKISDEMVIIIYSNDQVMDFKNTKKEEDALINKCEQKDDISLKNDACIEKDKSTNTNDNLNKQISINTATKEELMTLPGIGEAKAQEIIDYRNTNGSFNTIEDIKNISGIGDSIFAKIKDYITT